MGEDVEDADDSATPDVIESALAFYKRAFDHWDEIYTKAKADLKFLSDEPSAQWDSKDYEDRIKKGRPALQFDQLSQFINQVSNNVRMSTPSINVIPSDDAATNDVAKIIKGRIKDIEYQSKADDAYDTGVNSAIKCSIGFIRVDHDYKHPTGFEQELKIKRVVNPFAILLDPDSIEPDGSDAMSAIVIDELSEANFEREFPSKEKVSFCAEEDRDAHQSKNIVCIAEYFKIEITSELYGLLPNGEVEPLRKGVEYKQTRPYEKRTVRRYKLSGQDILEETTFPGRYIPIIPVYGEEAWEGGKRKLNSLIRRAKDPQRMFNYWKSTEAELLKRAPKAVAIAPGGVTEPYAEDWKNPDKSYVLRYEAKQGKDGTWLPAPTLNQPPPIPAGIVNASMAAQQDIKSTMGLYNAFVGQTSNETSGIAINARKVEGDRSVYHFGDNLVRSIGQVGNVLVCAIAEIEDTPKLSRIIGDDGNAELVGVNGALAEGQKESFFLSRGQYSIRVMTGSSLPTMKLEAAQMLKELMAENPNIAALVSDLFIKYQDFPGSEAIAKRLEVMLPPEIKAMMNNESQDPQLVSLTQQNQKMHAVVQQLQAQLQAAQADKSMSDFEAQTKLIEAQTKQQQAQFDQAIQIEELKFEREKFAAEQLNKQKEFELKERDLDQKQFGQEAALVRQAAAIPGQPLTAPSGSYQGEAGL